MSLRLVSSNGIDIVNGSGQILKFVFDSFLPTSRDTTDYSRFEVDVEAEGTQCLLVGDEGSGIKLQPTCVYDLRWIATTGEQYYLSEIVPNPVNGGVLDINFSIGFDGWTEVLIYNNMGGLVKRVATGEMRAGRYAVRVEVNDLSSGVYMVVLRSGGYQETKEFMLSK